jgi:hypothetical protein
LWRIIVSQHLDWLAVRLAKPCCVDEKDFAKANVMRRTCSAPADSRRFMLKARPAVLGVDGIPDFDALHSRRLGATY